ncbi:AraC-type DNA-binding protein [Pedobacter steynii]|uniref:AraC-type DNA-binding protein n=1 Tax=Pedobacter steynii TaxID=430522 RepID=A0A1G9ZBJ4_9SPHI|nr:AraC family transcriptional regulator [Pedobacter steynii]NQX40010.1 helix-turn-helix transcriptional regulator [Pedobacter steynii]SDN18674.1 AraC-type DNA-binding protein [Pedobacter steynii]
MALRNVHKIRDLFRPVQPAAGVGSGPVGYGEFLPDPGLQDLIYCYWQLKSEQHLADPYPYRVVADGCIDIFFELDNPTENYLMGLSSCYTEFQLNNSFNYIGIRFLPTKFTQLYGISAAELTDLCEPMEQILPETSSFIRNNFSVGMGTAKIVKLLDHYFLNLLQHAILKNDSRIAHAMEIILQSAGVLNVEKDLDVGLSPRQLSRLFEYYTGDTVKTFSKIVRFQNYIRRQSASGVSGQDQHYLAAGYYDQAHFIREFKKLYGTTPSKAFSV